MKETQRNDKRHVWCLSCAFALLSLYHVWPDVDAIYQVLKQAGEIRGNSTNSPPTPPTADHPPSGAAPSSARASSHPCSSSTSGKAQHQLLSTLKQSSLPNIGESYMRDCVSGNCPWEADQVHPTVQTKLLISRWTMKVDWSDDFSGFSNFGTAWGSFRVTCRSYWIISEVSKMGMVSEARFRI